MRYTKSSAIGEIFSSGIGRAVLEKWLPAAKNFGNLAQTQNYQFGGASFLGVNEQNIDAILSDLNNPPADCFPEGAKSLDEIDRESFGAGKLPQEIPAVHVGLICGAARIRGAGAFFGR